jgi:hypothetical protein
LVFGLELYAVLWQVPGIEASNATELKVLVGELLELLLGK